MSKRLDLHSKEQESTSHQAALVIDRGYKSYKHQNMGNMLLDMQGGETRRSERENSQRHGCTSEAERKAESEGGGHKQRAEQRTSQRREHRGAEAREILGGGAHEQNTYMGNAEAARHPTGGCDPNGEVPYLAVSHRRCAADTQKMTERGRGNTGNSNPRRGEQPTRRENGHAKRHWGRDCQCTRRHLIRKPAKLTGTRHELAVYMGGSHQIWCG
jgi:hypothetical protein